MNIFIIRGSYYKSHALIQSHCALHTAQGNSPHFLIKFISMHNLAIFSANGPAQNFPMIIRFYIKTFHLKNLISSWTTGQKASQPTLTDLLRARKMNPRGTVYLPGRNFSSWTKSLKIRLNSIDSAYSWNNWSAISKTLELLQALLQQ